MNALLHHRVAQKKMDSDKLSVIGLDSEVWMFHPFGLDMATSLYVLRYDGHTVLDHSFRLQHYEKRGDIQMVAMLSFVLQQHPCFIKLKSNILKSSPLTLLFAPNAVAAPAPPPADFPPEVRVVKRNMKRSLPSMVPSAVRQRLRPNRKLASETSSMPSRRYVLPPTPPHTRPLVSS